MWFVSWKSVPIVFISAFAAMDSSTLTAWRVTERHKRMKVIARMQTMKVIARMQTVVQMHAKNANKL